MANNNFNETIGSMFKGLDTLIGTKTVVGEPTFVGDTIIVPLVDVNFGIAAGAWARNGSKNSSAGGMGGKMSPNAILVIKDGTTRLINIKNADAVTKLMEIIPEVADKLIKGKDPAVEEAARNAAENSRETF